MAKAFESWGKKMIVINAENLILGRFATFAAKQALLGKEVVVINAEKSVLSGTPSQIIAKVKNDKDRGTPAKGPFIPNMADRYVRRTIRGMLPYKLPKGAAAFKRVMCYVGTPEQFKKETPVSLPGASVKKLPNLKYTTVEEVLKRT
jgi:large subunit ribosomal protein L13